MYCTECKCNYGRWTTCPVCKATLVEKTPADPGPETEPISYETLVEQVRAAGGKLSVKVAATDVGVRQTWGFPYRGYGLAWVNRMQGGFDGQTVDIHTTEVGSMKRYGFPYFGYGYAWSKGMQGTVAGHKVTLTAVEVSRKRQVDFPWLGYGSAWTEEWSGTCGDRLAAQLSTSSVGRKRGWRFPYNAFGYGWAREATLTLTLAD